MSRVKHADRYLVPSAEQLRAYRLARFIDNLTSSQYFTGPRHGQQVADARKSPPDRYPSAT